MRKNLGRNVINIEEIKAYMHDYAKEKKLSSSLHTWLEKQFLRWVINHFPQVQDVQSHERFRALVRGEIPAWFRPDSKEIAFIYVDIKHAKFQESLDKCVEFLASKESTLAHKFPRMTVEQVLQKWQEEHEQMKRRSKRYVETSTQGLESVFKFESFLFVKFKKEHSELSLEMARESAIMQHCLGEFENDETGEGGYGAYYFDLIKKEEIELFSLRDENNMPHATIALYKKEGVYWLDQIKGKQNQPPIEKYVNASVAFLNFLEVHYNYHADTLGMGVVYVQEKSRRIKEIEDEKIQQFLVAYDTEFIYQLPKPSKATLWLATSRLPVTVEKLEGVSDAMKISALLQRSILMVRLKFATLPTTPKEVLKSVMNYNIKERLFRFGKLQVGRV